MAMPLLLPFFFQGLNARWNGMGWGKRKEEVDGTLVREDFDFIWMYRRNGGRKLCERKGKRKEGREEELRGK